MALRIYIRKHSPECLEWIQERVAAGQIQPLNDDALKEYSHTQCKCGWWMYGTSDSGVFYKPQALKVYSRAAAEAKRKEANKLVTQINDAGISIAELLKKFLKARAEENNTDETLAIYSRVGERLVEFARKEQPPIFAAKDITIEHITRIRKEWAVKNKNSTVDYHVAILGMIFRYGMRKVVTGKLTNNPVDAFEKPPAKKKERGADVKENDETQGDDQEGEGHKGRTLPLDTEGDDNYRKILAAVEPFLTGKLAVENRYGAARCAYLKNYLRFSLLLELMYETGLRVSDAIHFQPRKLKTDAETAIYRTKQIKTGKWVTVFFPLDLAHRLRKLDTLYEHYVFFDNSMPWREFISANIWRTLHDLGEAIGIPGLRPHRFRDSFAVNMLNGGMTIGELSIHLGHTDEKTTRKYYNPYVKSREDYHRAAALEARKRLKNPSVSTATPL